MKPRWQPSVALEDRALAYGDGCFETLRVRGGHAPLGAYHRRRLIRAATTLGIPLDPSALDRAIAEAGQDECVLKLVLSRGVGGRGYGLPPVPEPVLYAARHPYTPPSSRLRQQGLRLSLSPVRLADQPRLAGLKHLNRLEQVLGRASLAPGADEVLMLDRCGRPVELGAMNLFLVRDGILCTPALDRCGVAGVAREYLLDTLAPSLGLEARIAPLSLEQLRRAHEVFACNSVAGILPVRTLGLWHWRTGEVTRTLARGLDALWQ